MSGEHAIVTEVVDTDTGDADQNIDALIWGTAWDTSGSTVLDYSFIDSAGDFSYPLGGTPFSSAFSAAQEAAAEMALSFFAAVIDVTFNELGDDGGEDNADGTLRFANHTGVGTAYGYYPDAFETGGDMAFDEGSYTSLPVGSYEFHTMLHELGHAMGLKHGHETTRSGGVVSGAMTTDKDSMEYSVMTYNSFVGQGTTPGFYTNKSGHYAQSLMMYDIAALQRLYGANTTENSGDSVYTFSTTTGEMSVGGVGVGAASAAVIFRTVWDAGGVDTYDLSNFTTDLMLDLTPEGYSDFDVGGTALRAMLNEGWDSSGSFVGAAAEEWASGHLYNALTYMGSLDSLIENAVGGTGDDEILGNEVGNTLSGELGADTIYGGAGKDDLFGGDDKDRLEGGDSRDELFGGKGKDRLLGNRGKDDLYGEAAKDNLVGGAGNDLLDGGKGDDLLKGGKGDDTLDGGAGADLYIFKLGLDEGVDLLLGWEDGIDLIRIAGGSMGDISTSTGGGDTTVSITGGTDVILDGFTGAITAADFDFS
ncbi:MAG: protease [Gammaproteobacteria bacterium]|nr:protease [Gammaproteobacteria bacterium]